jgi:hypothetical protein
MIFILIAGAAVVYCMENNLKEHTLAEPECKFQKPAPLHIFEIQIYLTYI